MKESNQNAGWCRLPFELMQDTNLTDKDILLYSIMLDLCADNLTCTVTQKEIAELSCGRILRKTFYDCLKRLERYGYIEHERTGRESSYKLADIIGLKRKPAIRQSKRPPEVPAEQGQQEMKLRYGKYQNVALTVDEFDKLVNDFGQEKTLSYIQRCDNYCQAHGKSYADYDSTIRQWIAEDNKKSKQGDMSDKEYQQYQDYMSVVNQFGNKKTKHAILTDDIKRQEYSELDDYLSMVNQF